MSVPHALSATRSRPLRETRLLELRGLRAFAIIASAAVVALVSSHFMPRGPVTPLQGVATILVTFAVGAASGYALRSRWTMVIAPLAYLVAYELGRIGIAGATLDGIRFDTPYGVIAFVIGRGLHGLLALLPMAIGASLGAGIARHLRLRSMVPTGTLTAGVIGLAVLVAWPASTPPVLDSDGQPVPGSVAELARVEIGGQEHGLLIRAADPGKPVLLYLSGGPGQSDLGFGRVLFEPLERDFVVVVYDQRGTGTSYAALDPTSTLTLEQAVSDTIAVTDYLRERFDEQRIYLLGESWGSTLGVLAVQARPDLYHAYIGSGQMVSQRVTDQIIWRDLLAHAQRTGDWQLYDQVLTLGEPPYRDTPWSNSMVMGWYPLIEEPYTPPAGYVQRGTASNIGPFGILASEYSFIDKANALRGLVDTFSLMYPQLREIDFRSDVTELGVPVWILDGAHELRGRRDLALEWYDGLQAPAKTLVTYDNAGHSVVFEQADAFRELMVTQIVPMTYR